MKQLSSTLVLSTLLAGAAYAPCGWCADEIAVGGVVRDAHGTPLLGTLVQLLGQQAIVVAQTSTDDHGRYSLRAGLVPGEYELRASGALLMPATLSHLHLQTGVRTAANFTMMALFDAGTLLPAEKRTAANASDDWRWTLRSIANRPLLRLVDASPAADEAVPGEIASVMDLEGRGQLTLEAGNGRFGVGGSRQELVLRRDDHGNGASMFMADLDSTAIPGQGGSYVLAAGLERHGAWGGDSRMLVDVASHAGLRTGQGSDVQLLRVAATDKLTLGDEITIDAGTLVTMEQTMGFAVGSAPYVRVSFQPSANLRIEYRLATDKALQGSEDLDQSSLREEMLSDGIGKPVVWRGLHQEIIAVQSGPHRDVSLAVYRDSLPYEAVQGQGDLPVKDVAGLPVIVDASTGTLQVAVGGYTTTGMNVALSQTIAPWLLARFGGQVGTALGGDGTVLHLADLRAHTRPLRTAELSGTLTVHTDGSGTILRVHYRWQSAPRLTQVDEFDDGVAGAFLGFDLRQRLCRGRRFHEIEAVAEANNVLRQGYELALGPDGQALHLTQETRSIQGGLAFSF